MTASLEGEHVSGSGLGYHQAAPAGRHIGMRGHPTSSRHRQPLLRSGTHHGECRIGSELVQGAAGFMAEQGQKDALTFLDSTRMAVKAWRGLQPLGHPTSKHPALTRWLTGESLATTPALSDPSRLRLPSSAYRSGITWQSEQLHSSLG